LFSSRTLFDVQNVWGRTAVDTQKPVDTSPLATIPIQDVKIIDELVIMLSLFDFV